MDTYTHGHDQSVLASHRWRTASNSAGYLVPHLTSGDDLLDVGCGVGTITLDLARLVAPSRVVGVENVEAPLHEARAVAMESGSSARFQLGDAYALEFDDGSFDVVHAHQVLQHLTDPVAALREFSRVCRPGGIVAARDADYRAVSWYPNDDAMDRWLEIYRTLAKLNGAEPDAGRHLRSWALKAGLTDVTSSASVWCFATPVDRGRWAGGWSQRVLSSSFAAQALERGLATQSDLTAISDAFSAWLERDDSWCATLHGEVLCRKAG